MNVRFKTTGDDILVSYDQRACTGCILPESFPGVTFDMHGLCSYCRDEQERVELSQEVVAKAIESAVAGAKPDRKYDCLALYSGGKDSSLALAVAQRKFGLRVLAFTLDNGFLSSACGANMRRVLDELGIDHVMFRPPGSLMRPLYRISMGLEFGDDTIKYSTGGCGSCISMVLASGMRFASAQDIPLLVGGWTPGQFTTSPLAPVAFLQDVIDRHFDPLTAASRPLGDQLAEWRATPSDAGPVGLLNPLYTVGYSEEAALEELAKLGWSRPADTDSCSTNCRLNSLLIVDHIKKHGFHPYVYELAHHVRLGSLSRAEAMEKITRVGIQSGRLAQIESELEVSPLLPQEA